MIINNQCKWLYMWVYCSCNDFLKLFNGFFVFPTWTKSLGRRPLRTVSSWGLKYLNSMLWYLGRSHRPSDAISIWKYMKSIEIYGDLKNIWEKKKWAWWAFRSFREGVQNLFWLPWTILHQLSSTSQQSFLLVHPNWTTDMVLGCGQKGSEFSSFFFTGFRLFHRSVFLGRAVRTATILLRILFIYTVIVYLISIATWCKMLSKVEAEENNKSLETEVHPRTILQLATLSTRALIPDPTKALSIHVANRL